MSKVLTATEISQQANAMLARAYGSARKTYYGMRWAYGKYTIYKTEFAETTNKMHTTTLARGLDKATADGMMKLLENPDE